MSSDQVEAVVAAFRSMTANWQAGVITEKIRRDVDALYQAFPADVPHKIRELTIGGVPSVEVFPEAASGTSVLYLHGGGYSSGSSVSHAPIAARIAHASGARVIVIDYRLVPEHRFPAAHDDALAAYQGLLDSGVAPAGLAVAGDSSGGGMALALLQTCRNRKLPLPACGVLMSPWADLACNGASYISNAERDPISSRGMACAMAKAYLGDALSPVDPLVSPVYGSFAGLPPLLVDAGDREIFLDDARQIAAAAGAAGVDVTFTDWPDMIHVWHLFASRIDEGRAAIDRIGMFLRTHLEPVRRREVSHSALRIG